MAGQPHRVGAGDAVGQGDFLEAEHELFAGGRIDDVHRPGQRAVGAGLRLVAAEHGVDDRRRIVALEGAKLFAAVADDLGHRRDHAGHQLLFAVRRERHVVGFVADGLGQHVELELEPAAIVGAHVHRQRLGDGTEAARLIGAIDPDFERHFLAILDMPDE